MKKKVLIVAYDGLGNSGVPQVIFNIVKGTSKLYKFDIVVFEDYDFYKDSLENLGCKIIKIQSPKYASFVKKAAWYFFKKDRFLEKQFHTIFKRNKYDIVHSFKEFESWPILKAAKNNGIPKRILHSNVIHDSSQNLFLLLKDRGDKRKALKYSTDLIGVSEKCCMSAFGKEKSSIIFNTYNENLFKYHEYQGNELLLLQVATFCTNKNQLFSLEIFKEVLHDVPTAKLVFYGKEIEQNYLQRMKDFILNNNLNNNVVIVNEKQQNFQSILNKVTFYLLPSKKEGASIVLVEAQACGIKAFASSSISNDINVGGCIFIDLKDNPQEWADKIVNEYRNAQKREKYEMYKFSNENFLNSIEKLYSK